MARLSSFNAATLTGSGSGTFEHGTDALDFTFTSSAAALGQPLSLVYTITGGSGVFAGYTGAGSSTASPPSKRHRRAQGKVAPACFMRAASAVSRRAT